VSWLTVCAERTLTEDIFASPSDVRDFYVDLNNIKRVHPLVVAVKETGRFQTAQGYVQTYRVSDRIPLGRFSFPIRYVARLCIRVDGDVVAEARQFPRVRLYTTVIFDEIAEGTRLIERIRIEAPRPLAMMTTREAVKAHAEMLAGIRRWFE
jgi:hypothetical protein